MICKDKKKGKRLKTNGERFFAFSLWTLAFGHYMLKIITEISQLFFIVAPVFADFDVEV